MANPTDRSNPDDRSDPNDGPREGYTDHEHVGESAYDQGREVETTGEDTGDSWWDVGLAGMFLIVGLALFLFPEPSTSAVGVGLLIIGVVLWALEAVF